MASRGATLLTVLSLSVCLLLPFSGGLAQEARFGERTSVVVVEVPVNVTKDGRPLRGLTAENFEVVEGKQRQRIIGFEVVDLAAVAAQGPVTTGVPLAARRHFLLLFDLTFAEPKSILLAREAAIGLVRQGLAPSDLVAVATYSAAHGAQLVLGFTPDREQAIAAIESLGLPQLLDRTPDPLRLVVVAAESQLAAASQNVRGGGARVEALRVVVEELKKTERQIATEQGRAGQNQVVALTRSFTDLASMMAGVDGRKHVVYLSEGFDPGAGSGRGMDEETALAVAGGEVWAAEGDRLYGSTRVQEDVERMLEAFRRADCVIQAVNVGGAHATGSDVSQTVVAEGLPQPGGGRDTLLTLARDTGGDLFENTNDLATAMGKMLDRTGVTYLLTIQPDGLAHDGSYHPLKVRLKDAPRGARVHHRAGYYAPDPRRAISPLERRLAIAAEILGGEDGGELPFSVLALPVPGPGAIPFVIEMDGGALLAGHAASRLGVEIYAYALDRESAVRGFVTQRVDVELAKVGATLYDTGLKFSGALELPPGQYSLRVVVRNAETGAQGLRTVPLEVQAVGAGPLVLPPLFADSQTWILARQTTGASAPDPFTFAGQPFLPAAKPVLATGAEAPVALLIYNLGAEQAQVRATVLGAAGQAVAGGKLSISAWRRGEGGAPGEMQGSFATAGLPPGEYLLRVTVTDPASGAAHTSSAPFVVAGS
jgi:VWFA-related protein